MYESVLADCMTATMFGSLGKQNALVPAEFVA
jgi:hypothetical protein